MSVERFSRGQIFMGMQCVACPHVGAEVEIRDTNDNLICNGVHEEIVPFGYERIFFRVVCAGLESYINQSVKIKVDGFIDGNTDHMKNVSFTDEKIVKFEKV
ncbi:hypothetical protein JXB41_00915 [Candidatus Woesearchaeota archaeon]|nr:hypothetical protein [Candidatus Woesearchaeota archaeon]